MNINCLSVMDKVIDLSNLFLSSGLPVWPAEEGEQDLWRQKTHWIHTNHCKYVIIYVFKILIANSNISNKSP